MGTERTVRTLTQKGKMMAMDPEQQITEIQDAADALNAWFVSQDIKCGRAVAIMSYLIGAMSVDEHLDFNQALSKLKLAHAASISVAMSAIQIMR